MAKDENSEVKGISRDHLNFAERQKQQFGQPFQLFLVLKQ